MKKVLFVFILLCFVCLNAISCTKKNPYLSSLSEVKYNLYSADGEYYSITCYGGFREFPLQNDMKVSTTKNFLDFRLKPKDGNFDKVYSVSFVLNGQNYGDTFSEDEITHFLVTTVILPEKISFDSLDVIIKTTDNSEKLSLKSLLPSNTITYLQAFDKGTEILGDFLKEHTTDDGLYGEIRLRVIVKNDTSYWYFGYHYGERDCIALLLNGLTGDLIATKPSLEK